MKLSFLRLKMLHNVPLKCLFLHILESWNSFLLLPYAEKHFFKKKEVNFNKNLNLTRITRILFFFFLFKSQFTRGERVFCPSVLYKTTACMVATTLIERETGEGGQNPGRRRGGSVFTAAEVGGG